MRRLRRRRTNALLRAMRWTATRRRRRRGPRRPAQYMNQQRGQGQHLDQHRGGAAAGEPLDHGCLRAARSARRRWRIIARQMQVSVCVTSGRAIPAHRRPGRRSSRACSRTTYCSSTSLHGCRAFEGSCTRRRGVGDPLGPRGRGARARSRATRCSRRSARRCAMRSCRCRRAPLRGCTGPTLTTSTRGRDHNGRLRSSARRSITPAGRILCAAGAGTPRVANRCCGACGIMHRSGAHARSWGRARRGAAASRD